LSFHKLDRAKDKNFWSVRVSRDVRLIVHKTDASLLLCYVDHHDKAYSWAERRRLERHPRTGAAQLVEIRETVREIQVPTYVVSSSDSAVQQPTKPQQPKRKVFAHFSDDDLLAFGVPAPWIGDVKAADEDSVFQLVDHLPGEAAEAILVIATGGKPEKPEIASENEDPFDHPDALRRFRVLENSDELSMALDYPWEKWTVFLHPSQRSTVTRKFNGPARVAGSAGTGKTIVAIHRAVHLAKLKPKQPILLTTFSESLVDSLRTKLERLVSPASDVRLQIRVASINTVAGEIFRSLSEDVSITTPGQVRVAIVVASSAVEGHRFSVDFLVEEWESVLDAWQIDDWERYRDFKRLGRKTRLAESQRKTVWEILQLAREELRRLGLITVPNMYAMVEQSLEPKGDPVFSAIVVDECQDISVAELRLLGAMLGDFTNGLFFAGDSGQRIFQTPFSWKSVGVDVRGRSSILKINYRTSHQIRIQADRLLDETLVDVDGNDERREGIISAFNGASPQVTSFQTQNEEINGVGDWLTHQLELGIAPKDIALIVRSENQFARAEMAVKHANLSSHLGPSSDPNSDDAVTIISMHEAKGLEFRSVTVMACDDDVVPLQSRIESVGDPADLVEVYNTERHLLYVACTRPRDHLLVTGVSPISEFLEDLTGV